jgi:hypothetical protein
MGKRKIITVYLYVLYLKSIEATKQKLSRKGETNRENKKEKGKL